MARQAGTDFDNFKANNRGDKPKITDKITPFKFPEKKWVTIRIFGGLYGYTTYWCKIDAKDMSPKAKRFPVISPSYDPATQSFDSTIYDPWYELSQTQTFDKDDKDARNKQLVQIQTQFYANAVSRAAQKQAPSRTPKPTAEERKSGFKDKDSDTWTPWVPVPIGKGLAQKIKELSGLNVVESKKTGAAKAYSVAHEKFGCDIRVLFDNDKAPADKYQVQIGERRALTEEELAYLQWDLSELVTPVTDEKENRRDYEGWATRMGIKTTKKRKHEVEEFDEDAELDEEEDEDEDDAPKSKKKVAAKKAPAKGKKKAVVEDDEEEDDEEDDDSFDDDDEDEDDEPVAKKGKKAPAKGKKKVVDEDEDDEEDDEDSEDDDSDEDDEDDEPAPKKGKKAPAKKTVAKGKKKVVEEEDEEEDDDFDEDEEDDEPAPKKKAVKGKAAPAKGKKKVVEDDDEDEEDDDFDEDEDEEEDEPAPKKKPAKGKAPVKGKKKVVEEDDDEDEEEEDEDDDFDEDDEEDEPAPKKKAPAKKSAKRR